jgi:phage-related protein
MEISPSIKDWKVSTLNDNCIKIEIDSSLSIEGLIIKILGPDRNLISKINVDSYKIEFCTYTGKPMFVELHSPNGLSVQYVKGSGKDFYLNNN